MAHDGDIDIFDSDETVEAQTLPRWRQPRAIRAMNATTTWLGSIPATVLAVFVVAWLATGPIFHFSDGWRLTINTVTQEL